MLPELSNFWGRSLDEVERKYELIQEIFKSLYKVKAKKYLEMGFEPDEAFEKVASEEKINIERIREMEKSLAGAQ
jgi:hypothetical protein